MLSHKVMLSYQALCRSAQVVSQQTSLVAAARRNLGTITKKGRGGGELDRVSYIIIQLTTIPWAV